MGAKVTNAVANVNFATYCCVYTLDSSAPLIDIACYAARLSPLAAPNALKRQRGAQKSSSLMPSSQTPHLARRNSLL